jgi:hypothetical protein
MTCQVLEAKLDVRFVQVAEDGNCQGVRWGFREATELEFIRNHELGGLTGSHPGIQLVAESELDQPSLPLETQVVPLVQVLDESAATTERAAADVAQYVARLEPLLQHELELPITHGVVAELSDVTPVPQLLDPTFAALPFRGKPPVYEKDFEAPPQTARDDPR